MSDQAKRAAVHAGAAVVGAAALTYAARELIQYAKGEAIIAGLPLAGLMIPLLVAALGYVIVKAAQRT